MNIKFLVHFIFLYFSIGGSIVSDCNYRQLPPEDKVPAFPGAQGSRYHKKPHKQKAEFCNNIIYNWVEKCSYGGKKGSYNIIGTVYRPGPATPGKK